jgi:hypothetical protein
LGISFALRAFALDWGVPQFAPGALPPDHYRPSYQFDEDLYLQELVNFRPAQGQWDVQDYHWGTLQFYLIYGSVRLGEAVGIIPTPWYTPFQQGDVPNVQRIYILARLVSVIAGVVGTLLVMALGMMLGGRRVGFAAGVAYTVAPLAVVGTHYLVNDVTMSTLSVATVLAAVLGVQRRRLAWLVGAGVLLGLATAAKYSGIFVFPAVLAAQWSLWQLARVAPPQADAGDDPGIHRGPPGWQLLLLPWLGAAVGFVAGEPNALLTPEKVIAGLQVAGQGNAPNTADGIFRVVSVLGWQVFDLAGLALTWPLAVLAFGGLALMFVRTLRRSPRRGSPAQPDPRLLLFTVVLAAIEGMLLGVALNRVPMLRYTQPLLPLLAVAAGLGWAALPRPTWRWIGGAVAVLGAAVVTLGQLSLLAGPHPVDALQAWLVPRLQPGQQVAQVWPEYPVLDETRYQLVQIVPWAPDLAADVHPDYILMNDMLLAPPSAQLATRLAQEYREVARFSQQPHLGPFAWEEGQTPHDWKYSHPTLIVYARR